MFYDDLGTKTAYAISFQHKYKPIPVQKCRYCK